MQWHQNLYKIGKFWQKPFQKTFIKTLGFLTKTNSKNKFAIAIKVDNLELKTVIERETEFGLEVWIQIEALPS